MVWEGTPGRGANKCKDRKSAQSVGLELEVPSGKSGVPGGVEVEDGCPVPLWGVWALS